MFSRKHKRCYLCSDGVNSAIISLSCITSFYYSDYAFVEGLICSSLLYLVILDFLVNICSKNESNNRHRDHPCKIPGTFSVNTANKSKHCYFDMNEGKLNLGHLCYGHSVTVCVMFMNLPVNMGWAQCVPLDAYRSGVGGCWTPQEWGRAEGFPTEAVSQSAEDSRSLHARGEVPATWQTPPTLGLRKPALFLFWKSRCQSLSTGYCGVKDGALVK